MSEFGMNYVQADEVSLDLVPSLRMFWQSWDTSVRIRTNRDHWSLPLNNSGTMQQVTDLSWVTTARRLLTTSHQDLERKLDVHCFTIHPGIIRIGSHGYRITTIGFHGNWINKIGS